MFQRFHIRLVLLVVFASGKPAFGSFKDVVDIKINATGARDVICEYQSGHANETVTKEQWENSLVCMAGASKNAPQISTKDTNEQNKNAKEGLESFFKIGQAKLYRGFNWRGFSDKIKDFSFLIYDYYSSSWVNVSDMDLAFHDPDENNAEYEKFLIGPFWRQDANYKVLHIRRFDATLKTGSVLIAKSMKDSHHEIVGIVQVKIEYGGNVYVVVERLDLLIDWGFISIKNGDPSFDQ